MNKKERWKSIEQETFEGWDFSKIEDELETENLNWDYRKIIKGYLSDGMSLLDMGTGGGEFLLTLNHPYHKTSVTEGYLANYDLCLKTLVPLGITVKYVGANNKLDYFDQCFDIVINRHEEYDIKEVRRVLKDDGIFITQQVGCFDNYDLVEKVMGSFTPNFKDINLNNLHEELIDHNFKVLESAEQFIECRFKTLEALIYYAKIIEWQFTGFSVENNYQYLCTLEDELKSEGYIGGHDHRLLLVAKKQTNQFMDNVVK